MNKTINQKHFYYLLLFIFGVAFYIMNVFTPMCGDDYAYCFFFDDHSVLLRPTPERVTSLPMALESMWNHNHIVNGRFISHFVLQCIDALCGKGVFNVLNTLFFVLLLHILSTLSGLRYSVTVLCATFLASMCVFPFPGQTMLWMTGSINYMWTTTIALLYVYRVERKTPKNVKWYIHILLFILGILAGWTNESITAPVALGLFIYYLTHRDHFKGAAISLYCGFAIGAALIIFGPGTFSRIINEKDVVLPAMNPLQFIFTHTYALFSSYTICVLPLVVLCYYLYKIIRDFRNRLLSVFKSLCGSLFFSFTLFLFALGLFNTERAFYGVSAICFIILIRICGDWITKNNRAISIGMIILCVLPIYSALSHIKQYHDADRYYCDKVLASPSQCVIEQPDGNLSSRYCYYGGMETLGADRYDYHNRVKAFYYGKEYIQALPKDVYMAWHDNDFSQLGQYHTLEVPPEKTVAHRISATYYYKDSSSELKFHQRAIRYLMNTLSDTLRSEPIFLVTNQDSCTYLIPADLSAKKICVPELKGKEDQLIEIYSKDAAN